MHTRHIEPVLLFHRWEPEIQGGWHHQGDPRIRRPRTRPQVSWLPASAHSWTLHISQPWGRWGRGYGLDIQVQYHHFPGPPIDYPSIYPLWLPEANVLKQSEEGWEAPDPGKEGRTWPWKKLVPIPIPCISCVAKLLNHTSSHCPHLLNGNDDPSLSCFPQWECCDNQIRSSRLKTLKCGESWKYRAGTSFFCPVGGSGTKWKSIRLGWEGVSSCDFETHLSVCDPGKHPVSSQSPIFLTSIKVRIPALPHNITTLLLKANICWAFGMWQILY